jgi:predicted  nucleic acid-binding Zn-ribbon protein
MESSSKASIEKEVKHTELTLQELKDKAIRDFNIPLESARIYDQDYAGGSAGYINEGLVNNLLSIAQSQISSLQEENKRLTERLRQSKESLDACSSSYLSQSKRIEELTGENERLKAEYEDFTQAYQLRQSEVINDLYTELSSRQSEVSRLTGEVERLKHKEVAINKIANELVIEKADLTNTIEQKDSEVIRLREALVYCQNKAYILVNTKGAVKDYCLTDAKKLKDRIDSTLSNSSTTKE